MGKYMKIFVANWLEMDRLVPYIEENKLGIEIQNFCNPIQIENSNLINEISKQVKNIKDRTVHGPYSELVPVSRDPEIKNITRKRFQQAYEIAKKLKASHLILHSGFIPKTYPFKDWLTRAIDFWEEFLESKDDKIEIHIENVYEDDFNLLFKLVETINKKHFSICLDIGHANANSSMTIADWINNLGDYITYYHLHNNNGILDDHFGLNKGTINMEKTIKTIIEKTPNAILSIETKDIYNSVSWLKGKI